MKRWLHAQAYPYFECENCVGIFEGYSGCYCAYNGDFSPGDGTGTRWQRIARAVYNRIYGVPNV